MRARRLSARWVIPVEGDPVERGAVLVDEHGRIAAVGPDAAVPRPPDVAAEDFPAGLMLPGLVNTHTHLELTGFGDGPPDPEFAAWIRALRERKSRRPPEAFLAAARQGVADCWAAGITTVADTGDSGTVTQALAEAGAAGIAYLEAFGPHPAQRDESLAALQSGVERLGRYDGGRVRVGVSPHAPYTVSGPLYAAVARWASAERLPVAVHVAESQAESELLARGSGPFADGWRRRGIPLPAPLGRTPVEWLADHGVLGERTLCIHAIRVNRSDRALLADAGAAVAQCPRSNVAHGHGAPPLGALLDAGIRLGLGTDSVASIQPIDLLAEARAAAALAPLSPSRLLALCTLEAARALGFESETGSLRTGKWADFVVLRSALEDQPPEAQALASGPSDVLATFVGGRNVYRADGGL